MVIDVARTGGGSKSIRLFPGEAPRASSREVSRPFPKYPPARYHVSSSSILPQGTPSLPRASSRKVPAPSTSILLQHISPLLRNQHLRFALNRLSRPSKDTIATQSGGLERIRRVSPMRRAGRWRGRNKCGGPVGGAGATGAACRSTMRGVVGGLGIADSSVQPTAVDPPARSATAGSSGRRAAADSSVRPAARVHRTGRQQLIHRSVWQRRARRAQRVDAAP